RGLVDRLPGHVRPAAPEPLGDPLVVGRAEVGRVEERDVDVPDRGWVEAGPVAAAPDHVAQRTGADPGVGHALVAHRAQHVEQPGARVDQGIELEGHTRIMTNGYDKKSP